MSAAPAASKWIDGLAADQTVAEAAHRVLELRLGAVWERLPAAAQEADQDLEHVHQLRVASRRAHAALELFKDCLPPRRARKIGKLLKRMRRAAGEARDCDVQRSRMQQLDADGGVSTKAVLPYVDRRRASAQGPIVDVYRELRRDDFPGRIEQLLNRLDARDDEVCGRSFGEYAAERLRLAEEHFFAAEAHGEDGYEALHQFRIRAKRLRYTLEILASLHGDAVRRDVYPIVEDLQDRLGEIVDTHVAIDLYRRWSRKSHCDGSRCAWRSLIAHQQAQLAKLLADFDQYWTTERAEALRGRLLSLQQASEPAATPALHVSGA